MRLRQPSPLRPFDITPPQVVAAAKRIFTLLWVNGRARILPLTVDGLSDQPAAAVAPSPSGGK